MNQNLIKSLTSLGTIGVCVWFIISATGCAPATADVGTAESPNVQNEVSYYQDTRTGVCFGMVFDSYEATMAVECTPKVLALIYGPTEAETETEIAR